MVRRPLGSKIPRSAPCPCGSGKRYKHCHGAVDRKPRKDDTEEQIRANLRTREATEILRKSQHGHGRPVVSEVLNNRRVIIVGDRSCIVPAQVTFQEFLIENMKDVLGRDWGQRAFESKMEHSLFDWLRQLSLALSVTRSVSLYGSLSALVRLAYGLYLIEHNDKQPISLTTRLRKPTEFLPAVYEAFVASSFAVAGAKIEGAEDSNGLQATPEFFATFASGRRFSVEAKRKARWKTAFDVADIAFQNELVRWIRNKLHAAAKKELVNPVYWLELSIPSAIEGEIAERLHALVLRAVRSTESLTVMGRPPKPAYVFVTNNADLAAAEIQGAPFFGAFTGFGMSDFRSGEMEIELAFDFHDRHRDIRRVFECFNEIKRVPVSFDGTPQELLDEEGRKLTPLQIGDRIGYADPDGLPRMGKIEELASLDDRISYLIKDEVTDQRILLQGSLDPSEVIAAKKYGDAIFGKPEGPRRDLGGDLFASYDKMLEIFGSYDRPALLRQVTNHPEATAFERLPTEQLRLRVSREMTKRLYSQTKTS